MKAWPPSLRSVVPNTPDVEERFLLSNSNKFPDGPRLFALPLGGRARPLTFPKPQQIIAQWQAQATPEGRRLTDHPFNRNWAIRD
jgi:hypothetical protein